MKTASITLAALALAVDHVTAFPTFMHDLDGHLAKASIAARQTSPPQGAGALPLTPPPFNATAQYVSNQGANAFIPPGPNDARGPCPGLNAMANHGYIPRNGIATAQQFISGTQAVFGMAPDLGGFLSYYGSFIDGNGSGWSIGGSPHTGIGGSHNNYETDSSPLKGDLDQYGSLGRVIMSQFYNLYNMQTNPTTANYNLAVLRNFRASRFQESIAKNPYYAYLPFTGIEVSQAAFTFIYRFMSNKSATYPSGILNKSVLKSFMSITGPENNLTWTFGNERIPDNWYKRNPSDEYSVPYFQSDILYFAQTVPQILNVGCNTGTVNSYNTITPETISGGAYTSQMVAKNPICFGVAYAASQAAALAGLSSSQAQQFNAAVAAVGKALGSSCPAITNANTSALASCPGFSTYGGPTGPVAPGSIQS